MVKSLLVGCAVLTMTCGQVGAQSFRCEDASTPLQQMICSSRKDEPSAVEFRPPACAGCETAICQVVAERFAELPGDTMERTPLSELSQSSESGITKQTAVERDEGSRGLLAWAAAQTPPVELPDVLTDEVFDSSWLEQLPGTAFYALHSVDGTAHCYTSMYFEVRSDGKAQIAAEPAGIPDDSCMVTRSFGTIDRAPVMFEEDYTAGAAMRSTLTIANRNSEGSWAACRLTFEYEPVFSDGASGTGADCTRLQSAAHGIAAAVQSNPQRARRELLAGLTASQQLVYEKAEEAMLAQAPGVTTLGHFTIGWRSFADWSVTFHEVAPDKLKDSGSFAVGMNKGRVKRTLIEAL